MLPESPHLLTARDLGFAYPGRELFAQLGFDIGPGLTLVRGGDGRGKSTLLRIIAGHQPPQTGVVDRKASTLFESTSMASVSGEVVAQDWLHAQRQLQPGWSDAAAEQWVQAFALQEHRAKPLYMLSTGSRRKFGLVAAAASGAQLTLLDGPFAALDAASCRVVDQMLRAAAQDQQRAWVVADHERPAAVAPAQLAGFIDLGD